MTTDPSTSTPSEGAWKIAREYALGDETNCALAIDAHTAALRAELARKDAVIAAALASRKAWMEWDGGSTKGSLHAATQSDAALRGMGVEL